VVGLINKKELIKYLLHSSTPLNIFQLCRTRREAVDLMENDCSKKLCEDPRTLLVKQVRQWGDLNTDALLDSSCKQFSIPSIEGFIGYRTELNCAIVFGDPVCPKTDQPQMAEAFQRHCKENGLNVIYAIVTEQFANSVLNQNQNVLIQFGNKLILEPNDNPLNRSGPKGVLVRKKVKHAIKDGVVISEYHHDDPSVEKEIEHVAQNWLEARNGPQVYIAHLDFFNDMQGKRWFIAKHDGHVIGFLILNEIQASSGWLLNNLIITRDAPTGTSELLVTTILQTLEAEKCNYVAVGPVTGDNILHIIGLGTFSSWLLHWIFKAAKKIFRLDGQKVFWEKFQPKHEPSYVMFDRMNIRTVKALLRAMNVKL
jgi:lysylphosphatidylglycerol synthetase-like protein (DUF2156 family)